MIIRFTIGATSGRQGIRTLIPLTRKHALAGRLGQPYPTTFRSSGPTGSRTRVPGLPSRCRSAGRWALRSLPVFSGPPGSRTARPPWQGGRLPLHHGHDRYRPSFQRAESTEWDSNPRCRITGAVSSPLDDQCLHRNGAGGTRTPADRLKRPTCCRYTTTPVGKPRAGVFVWSRPSPRSSLRVLSESQGGRIRTGGLKPPELADWPGYPTP